MAEMREETCGPRHRSLHEPAQRAGDARWVEKLANQSPQRADDSGGGARRHRSTLVRASSRVPMVCLRGRPTFLGSANRASFPATPQCVESDAAACIRPFGRLGDVWYRLIQKRDADALP